MRASGRLAAVAVVLLLAGSWLPLACSSGGGGGGPAARAVHITTDTLETTVEVQKGGRYYFSIGPDNKLSGMPVPDLYAGMPPEVARAVDRAPQWLQEDLAGKLRELATYQVNPGRNARLAVGDADGDGRPDAAAAGYGETIYHFTNEGSAFSPMLVRGEDLPFALEGGNLSLAAGDLNGDGRADLAAGRADGTVSFILNLGGGWELGATDLSASPAGRAAPTLGDLDGDGDLDLVVGDGAGKVSYFQNDGNRSHYQFSRVFSGAFAPLVVPPPACPALADLDGDGAPDLAVGGGNGIIHYFHNLGTPPVIAWSPDDLSMFAGISAAGQASPTLADIDGDGCLELLVGEGTGTVLFYENTGSSTDARWRIWPFYEYTPQIGYYPAEEYVTHVAYGEDPGYAAAVDSIEQRCVDELAFSIAHSAVEALRASSPELYVENALSIYKNDQYLDYVQVVDHADYSTTRYTVNESGRISAYELPRDIYYWYIVHPKITDEMPLYIDPDEPQGSVNESRPPPDGKFWRDWLLFNADPAYPPDPPTDPNGDGVPDFHYPNTMGPPLLADLMRGVTTMWNCTRYRSPAGYDNAGVNNSHPADFGDHALEKVSYWVMKTLPLNEQESADGERPIQPVRIARGHNGNCGELGDLTVAAARACLIPAVQVSMLAEDHVWIQFYERGWHQWDNYWSDGGAVIDDFMNYWIGWGHRGGSGVSGWRGDDYAFEVTGDYVPPFSQSRVTVTVRDSAGHPVDGARVVMMSHWMAEQQQLPLGITFPFPAVWNYTDTNGSATFVLARQNFTIDVVSKLGHSALNKTWIGEGQNYTFDFTLPGRAPNPEPPAAEGPLPGPTGRLLKYGFWVLEGEQLPPNPQVGTTTQQPVRTGLHLDAFICDAENFTRYLSGAGFEAQRVLLDDQRPDYTRTAHLIYDRTSYLVLSGEDALETSKTVHVRLELSVLHEAPGVVIDYPLDGTTVDCACPLPVSGRVLGSSPVASLELSVDGGRRQNITSGLDRASSKWRWDTDLSALPAGVHVLEVAVMDTLGYVNRTSATVRLDRLPPTVLIDEPAPGAAFGLDALIAFSGRAFDDSGVEALTYRIDDLPALDITASLRDGAWNLSTAGGNLLGGRHTLEVRAVDGVGRSGSATTHFELRDDRPPDITITSPRELEEFEMGGPVLLEGTVRDDSALASLSLSIGGLSIDLLPSVDSGGGWRHTWDGSGRADGGEVPFTVTAVDAPGNRATASRRFVLEDSVAPRLELLRPVNGTVFRIGEAVNLSGRCNDDAGVLRLEARFGPEGWRSITGSLRDGEFRHLLETDGLPPGRHNITVRAQDRAGNTATVHGYVNLESPGGRPAAGTTSSFIPGPEAAAMLAALALAVAAAGRARRREREA